MAGEIRSASPKQGVISIDGGCRAIYRIANLDVGGTGIYSVIWGHSETVPTSRRGEFVSLQIHAGWGNIYFLTPRGTFSLAANLFFPRDAVLGRVNPCEIYPDFGNFTRILGNLPGIRVKLPGFQVKGTYPGKFSRIFGPKKVCAR